MLIGSMFWISVALVWYVYLGYPLAVLLLSRLRPAPVFRQEGLPSVTVVISACGEESVIRQKLENVLSLNYPPEKLQVLVAVDGSEDRTADIVRSFEPAGVELDYSPERRGKAAAINRVRPLVRGDVIVFSDANNRYGPDALLRLTAPFGDPRVGAVSGAKHISEGTDGVSFSEGLYWRYESAIKTAETRLGSCVAVCGEILALRRNLFQPLPEGVINDDFHMALAVLRAGLRVVYEPLALSVERASSTAREEMIRRKRIVAGRMRAMRRQAAYLPWRRPVVLWQIVSHKFLRPFVPFAMVAALAASVLSVSVPRSAPAGSLLHLTAPWNWLMLSAQAALYLSAWAGNHVPPRTLLGRVLFIPTFLFNSNMASLSGICSELAGRQSAVWQRVTRRRSDENG